MRVKQFFRYIGILGITATATLGAPQLPAKKLSSEEEEKSHRKFDDSDIIGSSDWKTQGEWLPLRSMDEHIHRYGKLEELVSMENEDSPFWIKVKMVDEGNNSYALHGTRNDGKDFMAKRILGIEKNKDFDSLCDDLNKFLNKE